MNTFRSTTDDGLSKAETWTDVPVDDYSWLPKVELHCHLEGTMRPATVSDLAAANGIELPTAVDSRAAGVRDREGLRDVSQFAPTVLVTPDDWERLAFESMYDAAQHRLRHREAFFTPSRHLAAGQDLAEILAALDRGFEVAERVTGARCSLVFDVDGGLGSSVADEHVERLVTLKRCGWPGTDRVVGIGLETNGSDVDPLSFVAAFANAARAGLRRTAHLGSGSSALAIAAAVDVLGCERIDHGTSILGDDELVRRFEDEQIPLTVCPSADVWSRTGEGVGLSEHAFPTMRDADLLATLNTDRPALVGLDLGQEYALCARTFGYDTDDMVELALDAVRASWLDDGDVTLLMGEIKAASATRPAVPLSA